MNRRIFSTLWSLMQRELWESPGSFKWTPAGIIALTIFFVAVGLIFSLRVDNELVFTLDAIRQFSTVDMEQKRLFMSGALFAVSAMFFQIMLLVLLFYLSSCLYDERKDRSILFWKSLPVSDSMTVMSKLLTACLLAPLLYLAAVIITQLVLLATASVYGFMAGVNPLTTFWLPAQLPNLWTIMALGLVVQALWLLPVYAWLMFCSSWAPRVPILVAVIVPAIVAMLQHVWSLLLSFSTPDTNIGWIILKRLGSGMLPNNISWQVGGNGETEMADVEFSQDVFMSYSNSLEYLARPDMWLGLAVAAVLLAGAIWFRRRAADS
ncbi:MAG TPA: hypothetical protein VK064_08090 [Wenzhouxiangella sp.]|nr:hypothetical protein [Wenzhouxiangella sp.]HLS06081.1 hypothetical protein [Wenzhouxiangella sp.]